jgi:hypothetical protein
MHANSIDEDLVELNFGVHGEKGLLVEKWRVIEQDLLLHVYR